MGSAYRDNELEPWGEPRPLLERLGDRSSQVRERALDEADALAPEQLARQLAGFERLADIHGNRGFMTSCLGVPAVVVMGVIGTCISFGHDFAGMTLALSGVVGMAAWANMNRSRRDAAYLAAETLTRCRNRGAAGALLMASALPRRQPPIAIQSALTDLLGQFQEGDEALLNLDQRDFLFGYRSPSEGVDAVHQVAMLRAISVFAHPGALAKARAMRSAASRQITTHPAMAQVVAAATEAEQAIEARQAARRNARHLLRPADTAGEAEQLLRPAGAATGGSDALLRPAADQASTEVLNVVDEEQP
jgi:hypothetical protein